MINFAEIELQVDDAFKGLVCQPGLAGALCKYEAGGGKRRWQVAGIYAYEDKHNRLVIEALHSPANDTCAIRVYSEKGTTIHYARKVVGSVAALPSRLEEAAREFQLRLPTKLLDAKQLDLSAFDPHVVQALLPIPPPVMLAELKE